MPGTNEHLSLLQLFFKIFHLICQIGCFLLNVECSTIIRHFQTLFYAFQGLLIEYRISLLIFPVKGLKPDRKLPFIEFLQLF